MISTKDEHKESECWGFWCQLLLSILGITFLFTGIIMADLWPQIFGDMMKNVRFKCKDLGFDILVYSNILIFFFHFVSINYIN